MIGQGKRLRQLRDLEISKEKKTPNNFAAISSGKGGTGKTFLAANIAYALSELNNKILLVDLDLNFATVNFMMNRIPAKSIRDVIAGKYLFDQAVTTYKNNLDIIFGNSDYESSFEFDQGIINSLLNNLNSIRGSYDFIILDLPSGSNKYQLEFLSACSINLFVSTPEPTSVIDSYVMMKFLNKLDYRGRKLCIINKINNEAEGIEAYNNLNTAAKHFMNDNIDLLGFISYDTLVPKSISNQKLLLQFSSTSTISTEIFHISRELIEFNQLANIPQKII